MSQKAVCSLASEKAPDDLRLQVSTTCAAPLHWIRAGLCEDWSMGEMMMGDFQGYVRKALQLLLCSLGSLLWSKLVSVPGGDSCGPVERPTQAGTEALGQQPSTSLPCV